MARPSEKWVKERWTAKAAWHSEQRAGSMRDKVAGVLRLQERQRALVATKRALGQSVRDAVVWQTRP